MSANLTPPTMEEVAALSDAEIGEFLGHPAAVANLREELSEILALKGKAREEAETMWAERITPKLDSYSLRWIKEDAVRAANPKKGKELLDSTDPDDIF